MIIESTINRQSIQTFEINSIDAIQFETPNHPYLVCGWVIRTDRIQTKAGVINVNDFFVTTLTPKLTAARQNSSVNLTTASTEKLKGH